MNLTSCDKCGVVLDKDKLNFPEDFYFEEDGIDESLGTWDHDKGTYVPYVGCAVCKGEILREA